jgi:hypothetical protein
MRRALADALPGWARAEWAGDGAAAAAPDDIA